MIPEAPPKLTIADVFITDELDRRAPKKTDYLQEKMALKELAARMADQPEEVLPRFVDLALEMTGGVSGGLRGAGFRSIPLAISAGPACAV
jgi:hypothetical protein